MHPPMIHVGLMLPLTNTSNLAVCYQVLFETLICLFNPWSYFLNICKGVGQSLRNMKKWDETDLHISILCDLFLCTNQTCFPEDIQRSRILGTLIFLYWSFHCGIVQRESTKICEGFMITKHCLNVMVWERSPIIPSSLHSGMGLGRD